MSKPARQGIMNEHIATGHQFPTVKINTTYSFGIDDQEFVVAFETDFVGDFLDLMMTLRETEASRYTERDTPIFTCRVGRDARGAGDAGRGRCGRAGRRLSDGRYRRPSRTGTRASPGPAARRARSG